MTDISAAGERRWRQWSILGVAAALLIGVALGIVVVPLVQGEAGGVGAYTAICRAIGILPGSPARPTPLSEASAVPVTRVSWTEQTMAAIYGTDPSAGAALA